MKRSNNSRRRAGFTLFELVVVLAILAVVTTLAIRSLDGLEDQSRYEKNVRGFEELSAAVLGTPDDRAADGTRTVSGFVADMGRLPKAVADGNGNLTLAELWLSPGTTPEEKENFKFNVRQAIANNCTPDILADSEVVVPGGWRGPYLRLSLGPANWLDGWGNPMSLEINAVQEILKIRHLGANGVPNEEDTRYDKDGEIDLSTGIGVTLSGQITLLDGYSPDPPRAGDTVTICVFGPDPEPENAGKISVLKFGPIAFTNNVAIWQILGATIGPRVVRAYLNVPTGSPTATALKKSTVKHLTLRPGVNLVNLTIDR